MASEKIVSRVAHQRFDYRYTLRPEAVIRFVIFILPIIMRSSTVEPKVVVASEIYPKPLESLGSLDRYEQIDVDLS